MELAIRARIIAMTIIAILLPIINFEWEMLWYLALVFGFIGIGLLQRRYARVGASRPEISLIFADVILMVVTVAVPNPFNDETWPWAAQYRGGGFIYIFVIFAFATLAYSWRTVWGFGVITAVIWMATYGVIEAFGPETAGLSEAVSGAVAPLEDLAEILDPNSAQGFIRIQEAIVLLIVAGVLATTVRRFSHLMMGYAALERERANLSRYFSPNVVDQLSHSDEPLKTVKTQDIAVLFVDIVGFTRYAAEHSSEEVIRTLRDFHARMESEVFAHGGTLDKYLGDGLMATFGTPFAGERDATNAFECAKAMKDAMAIWNREREAAGEPPIRASFGLHYGPAVLGDIGANRLEFAVIGNTVNVASRVEALTRALHVELAATAALKEQVERESGGAPTECLSKRPGQTIRGLDKTIDLWTLGDAPPEGATIH